MTKASEKDRVDACLVLLLTGELLHILYALMDNATALLILGIIIPPWGIIHGIARLIGLW